MSVRPTALRRVLGSAVATAWSGRIALVLIAPVTAVAIVSSLSLEEQGFWYTFGSLIAIASHAELGVGQVFLQLAADAGFRHDMDPVARRKLQSGLLRIMLAWCAGVAVVLPALGILLGTRFFGDAPRAAATQWHGPWVLLCIVAPLHIGIELANAYLEGSQHVAGANLRRTTHSAIYAVVAIACLLSGLGLWSAGIAQASAVLVSALWIVAAHGTQWGALLREHATGVREPFRMIWPLQWRYALTWSSGILIFHLFTPVVFKLLGAQEAGRFGFSLNVIGTIGMLAQVWLSARIALLTRLNASLQWSGFLRLYDRSRTFTLLSFAAGAALVPVLLPALRELWPRLAERFVGAQPLLLLVLWQALIVVVYALTTFVRSFRVEPFVRPAWITAVVSVLTIPFFTRGFGTTGAALSGICAQLAALPIYYAIYRSYRRRVPAADGQPAVLST